MATGSNTNTNLGAVDVQGSAENMTPNVVGGDLAAKKALVEKIEAAVAKSRSNNTPLSMTDIYAIAFNANIDGTPLSDEKREELKKQANSIILKVVTDKLGGVDKAKQHIQEAYEVLTGKKERRDGGKWGSTVPQGQANSKITALTENKNPNLKDLYSVLEDDDAKEAVHEETAYATILTYAAREASRYDQSFSRFANIELDAAGTAAKFKGNAGYEGLAALDLEGVASVDDLTDPEKEELRKLSKAGMKKIDEKIDDEDYTVHATVDDAVASIIKKANLSDLEKKAFEIDIKIISKNPAKTLEEWMKNEGEVQAKFDEAKNGAGEQAEITRIEGVITAEIESKYKQRIHENKLANDIMSSVQTADATKIKEKNNWTDAQFEADIKGKIVAKRKDLKTLRKDDVEAMVVELLAKDDTFDLKKQMLDTHVDALLNAIQKKANEADSLVAILNTEGKIDFTDINKRVGDRVMELRNNTDKKEASEFEIFVKGYIQKTYKYNEAQTFDWNKSLVIADVNGKCDTSKRAAYDRINAANPTALESLVTTELTALKGRIDNANAAIELKIKNAIDVKYVEQKNRDEIAKEIVRTTLFPDEKIKILNKKGWKEADLEQDISAKILQKRKELKKDEGIRVEGIVQGLIDNPAIFDINLPDINDNISRLLAAIPDEKDRLVASLNDDGVWNQEAVLGPRVQRKIDQLKNDKEIFDALSFETDVKTYISDTTKCPYDTTKNPDAQKNFEANVQEIINSFSSHANLAAYNKQNPAIPGKSNPLKTLIETELKKRQDVQDALEKVEIERNFESAEKKINKEVHGAIESGTEDEVVTEFYVKFMTSGTIGAPGGAIISNPKALTAPEKAALTKKIGNETQIKDWLKQKVKDEATVIPKMNFADMNNTVPKTDILELKEAEEVREEVINEIRSGNIEIKTGQKDILSAFPDVSSLCGRLETRIGAEDPKNPLTEQGKEYIRQDARSIIQFILDKGFPAPTLEDGNQTIKDAITKCRTVTVISGPALAADASFDDLLNFIETNGIVAMTAFGQGGTKKWQELMILGLRRNLARSAIGDTRWTHVNDKKPPTWKTTGGHRGWDEKEIAGVGSAPATANAALYGENLGAATTPSGGRRRKDIVSSATTELPLTPAELAEYNAWLAGKKTQEDAEREKKEGAWSIVIKRIAGLKPDAIGEGEKDRKKRAAKREETAKVLEAGLDDYQKDEINRRYSIADDADAIKNRINAITRLINAVHGQRGKYIISTESLPGAEKTALFDNMDKIENMLDEITNKVKAGKSDEEKAEFRKELPERLYQIILDRGGETGDTESKEIYLQYLSCKKNKDIEIEGDDIQMICYLQMVKQMKSAGGVTYNLQLGAKGWEKIPGESWAVHGADGTYREEFMDDIMRYHGIIDALGKPNTAATRELIKIAAENCLRFEKLTTEEAEKLQGKEKAAYDMYQAIKKAENVGHMESNIEFAYKFILFMENKLAELDIKKVKYWREVDPNEKPILTADMDKSRENYAKARRKLQNFFGHKDAKTNIDPAREEYMRIYRQKITNDVKSHIDSSGGIPDKNGNRVYFRGYGTEAEKAPGRQALAQLIVKKILYERRQLLNAEIKNQSASHYEKFKTWWRKHPMWRMAGAVAISGTACMLGAPMIGYAALALGRAAGTFMATESIFESVRNRMTGRLAGNDKNARLARFTSLGLSMRPGYGAMPVLPAFDDEGGGREYVKDVYGGVGMPNIGDYRERESQLLWQEQRNSVLETAAENAMKNSTTREDAIHKGIESALAEEKKFMLAVEHQEKFLRTTNIIKKSLAGLAALTVGTMALWGHVGVSHGATPHPGPGTGGNIPAPAPGEADDILPPESQTPEAPDPYSFQLTPEELEAQEALERQTIHLDMKGRQWNFAPGT